MKRGRIYSAARREGYNVLAFGQHLDDLSERYLDFYRIFATCIYMTLSNDFSMCFSMFMMFHV